MDKVKAVGRLVGNLIIYGAAVIAALAFGGLIPAWPHEHGALLAVLLMVSGLIAQPVLDDYLSDLVYDLTGSYHGVRVLATAFAVILGIGIGRWGEPGWHPFALLTIGLVGLVALCGWILPQPPAPESGE